MAQNRVRDILLRITGDPGDAKRSLQEVAQEVSAFGRIKATATVDVDTKAATAGVDKATAKVKEFGRLSESAKIDLQEAGLNAQLQRLHARLDALKAKDASPKVDIAIAGTVAKIERVEAKLDALDRRRVDINVDIDRQGRMTSALSRITSLGGDAAGAMTQAVRGFGVFAGTAASSIPVLGGFVRALVAVGASAGPVGVALLALVPIIIALGVAIAGSLIVALGSLAASFAFAAAGAAALATALVAAFGPVVLVIVAAVVRLAQVLKAVKEEQTRGALASRQVRDAHQQQAAATDNLRQAQERLKTTTVEAYRAQRDAAEEVRDAIQSIADAELSRDQARLNTKQAEAALRDFRKEAGLTASSLDDLFHKFTDVDFQPENLLKAIQGSALGGEVSGSDELDLEQLILNVRAAKNQETHATDDLSDATTRLQDARAKEAEFAEKGIEAYQPYVQALRGVKDAENGVRDATEKLTAAREDRDKTLKTLTPRERELATTLTKLKDTLAASFRPATDRIFDAVLDALKELQAFADSPQVRRGLTDIGRAFADVIRTMGRELRRPEIRNGFRDLARGGADLIRILGSQVFISAFRLFLRIAREALPPLLRYARDIGRAFVNWEEGTRSGDRIRRLVQRVLDSFDDWLGLIRAVARLLRSFFRTAADEGDGIVETLTNIVNRWAAWIEKNPEKVKQFFRDAISLAGKFFDVLGKVLSVVQKVIDAASKAIGLLQKVIGFEAKVAATQDPLSRESGRNAKTFDAATQRMIDRLIDIASGGGARARRARQSLHSLGVPGYATGGVIRQMLGRPGSDSEPILAEPGEYMLRRSVAQAIGTPRLDLINSGRLDALAPAGGGGGMTIQEQHLHLPPAPGHDQLGDPRVQAALFAREMRRRGGGGLL